MYVRSLLRGSSAFYALHLLQRPLVLSQMLVVLTFQPLMCQRKRGRRYSQIHECDT